MTLGIISWQKIHIDYCSNSYRDIRYRVSRDLTGKASGSKGGEEEKWNKLNTAQQ